MDSAASSSLSRDNGCFVCSKTPLQRTGWGPALLGPTVASVRRGSRTPLAVRAAGGRPIFESARVERDPCVPGALREVSERREMS